MEEGQVEEDKGEQRMHYNGLIGSSVKDIHGQSSVAMIILVASDPKLTATLRR